MIGTMSSGGPPSSGKPASSSLPDLELDIPRPSGKAIPAAKKAPEPEARLELAVDLRANHPDPSLMYGGPAAPLARVESPRRPSSIPVGTDVSFDARLLAD